MLNIFKILEKNENLKQLNPYFLTHYRVTEKKYLFQSSRSKLKIFLLEKKYNLIKAKINGFFFRR